MADGTITIDAKIDTSKASSQLLSLENRISKLSHKISALKAERSGLKSDEFKATEKDIETTEKKLNSLIEKLEKMKSLGVKDDSRAYQSTQYDIEKYRDMLAEYEKDKNTMLANGLDRAGTGDAKYDAITQKIREAEAEMGVLSTRYDEVRAKQEKTAESSKKTADSMKSAAEGSENAFEKVRDQIQKAADTISAKAKTAASNAGAAFGNMRDQLKRAASSTSQSATGISGSLGKIHKRITKLVSTVFIFSVITKALRAMRTAVQEGFNNYVKYSAPANQAMSGLVSALATLKNALGAAFAPIITAVVPVLTQLVNWITSAVNAVAKFIALITGKSYWTKATKQQKNYAESLDKTSKSAKSAQSQLAKFDELNVLNSDSGSDSGSSGDDAASMFEEVPLTGLDALKDRLKELKDIFMDGFKNGLGDPTARLKTITDGIQKIKDALKDIFTDPAVVSSANKYVNSVARLLGTFAGSVASVGLTMGANLVGGLADYLTNNTARIKKHLVTMFDVWTEINDQLSDFLVAFAYIFEAWADSNGVACTSALIGIFSDAVMGIDELLSKGTRDWITALTQPVIDNAKALRTAFDGILGVCASVLKAIKALVDGVVDALNDFYDAHIKPFFDALTSGISTIWAAVLKSVNTYIIPALQNVADLLEPFVTEYIMPLVDAILDLLGVVVDTVTQILNACLVPLITWIAANILPIIGPIIETLGTILVGFLEIVVSVITFIIEQITEVLTFVRDGFTVGWAAAWDNVKGKLFDTWNGIITRITNACSMMTSGISNAMGTIKSIWSNTWEAIKNTTRNVINGIIRFINRMVEGMAMGINGIADLLNNLSFDLPDIMGGGHVGFNLGHVTAPQIPELANGAVIQGGSPFLAMLGDQPAGQTNIEAPLDTITQAVRASQTDQIRVLQEQNQILYQILGKTGIVSRDIFNAVVNENNAYISRNGHSALAY